MPFLQQGVLYMVLNIANKWAAEAARAAGRPGGGCALDAPAAVDLSEGAAFARRQASSQPGTVGDHVGMLTSTAVQGSALPQLLREVRLTCCAVHLYRCPLF